MKKLMFGLAAAGLCGAVFADVTSANVVGYQNTTHTDVGFKYVTPTFLHIDGSAVNDFQDIQLDASVGAGTANIQLLDRNGIRTVTYMWCDKVTAAMQDPVIVIPNGKTGLWTIQESYWDDEEEMDVITYRVIDGDTSLKPGFSVQLSTGSGKVTTYTGSVSDHDIVVTNTVGGFIYIGNPFPQTIALDDIQMDASVGAGTANIQFLDRNGIRTVTYMWCDKVTAAMQSPALEVPAGYNGVWAIQESYWDDEEEMDVITYKKIDPAITLAPGMGVQLSSGPDKEAKIFAPYSL